jgi:hypothetical protein
MAAETLVSRTLTADLVRKGKEYVDELKRQRYPLRAAFWMITPSDPRWRLVLVSDQVTAVGRLKAYERALKWAPPTARLYWPALVSVEDPNDPLIRSVLTNLNDTRGEALGEVEMQLPTSTYEPTRLYVYEA